MATTITKVKTELDAEIVAGDILIVEFYDDVATFVLTIDYPNGASNTDVWTSTDISDTLNSRYGKTPVWISWPYGTITTNTQKSMICPNGLKIHNSGAQTIHVSGRGNLRG